MEKNMTIEMTQIDETQIEETQLDEAQIGQLEARNWKLIPLKYRDKMPLVSNWTTPESSIDVRTFAKNQRINIGVLLGDASGGLVDIVLDCPAAIAAAKILLPETGCKFGRASAREAHWLYMVDEPGASQSFNSPDDGSSLIEYRANGGQTMVPPSVHPNGEFMDFDLEGEPTKVTRDTLLRPVKKIAAVCVLAQYWVEGSRHDKTLALSGGLASSGWSIGEVREFVEAVCMAASDDDLSSRQTDVDTTYQCQADGKPFQGWASLVDQLGQGTIDKIREWLDADVLVPTKASSNEQVTMFSALDIPSHETDAIQNTATIAREFASNHRESLV
jgi:hypothetical protein